MNKLTKAQERFLVLSRDKGGILATSGLQKQMQIAMRDAGLIEKDQLGYYVPTSMGYAYLSSQPHKGE